MSFRLSSLHARREKNNKKEYLPVHLSISHVFEERTNIYFLRTKVHVRDDQRQIDSNAQQQLD